MKKDPEYRERAYKAVFFGEKNAEEDPVKTMGQKQYQARLRNTRG